MESYFDTTVIETGDPRAVWKYIDDVLFVSKTYYGMGEYAEQDLVNVANAKFCKEMIEWRDKLITLQKSLEPDKMVPEIAAYYSTSNDLLGAAQAFAKNYANDLQTINNGFKAAVDEYTEALRKISNDHRTKIEASPATQEAIDEASAADLAEMQRTQMIQDFCYRAITGLAAAAFVLISSSYGYDPFA